MSNNPFPGLRHFEQKETHLFFGRDGQSKELLKRLQDSRFLALVGVSGSGKSSLVRAGLLPALHGGLMSAVESDWRIAVFRPGNNPIGNMARALITQAGFGSGDDRTDIEVAVAETALRRGNLGLLELIRKAKKKLRSDGRPYLAANENVLIVVDQFEEIFRIIEQHDELVRVKQLSEGNSDLAGSVANGLDYHPREEASAFVKLLLESTRKNKKGQYDENIYIIVTMRSDYLGETAQFWGMPERINEGQYLIPRMNRDDRRKAIVGPVAVAGGSIAEPLVNQLLNDAGENPGHLPILQHALMRMWELAGPAAHNNGGLQLSHYDQIGNLSGALSQHANEAFAELSPEHQKLAATVFKCLTEKGLANREIRRPMSIAGICDVVGAKESDVTKVVECFRKEGRWFLMPPPTMELQPDTLIDISHESLISGWDKLSKWVNEEAESARTYKRLADTAILKDRGEEEFYRGTALQVALKWREVNAPNAAWARRYHPEFDKAIAFLDSSLKDTQQREQAEKDRAARELRRTRNYNIGLLILAIVSAGIAVYAYSTKQRAVAAQQAVVEAQKEVVKAQQLALETEKDRVAGETKLKDAAIAEQTRAQLAERKAIESLAKEQKAVKEANDAKAVAIAQRDKAKRLQQENLDQATNYGYFKTAFDNVAEREYDKAVSSLRKAQAYFKEKESKARTESERQESKTNRITTHINIADVYRSAADNAKDSLAVREYDRAIDLIGSGNNQMLVQTLMKAGSVWKDSTNNEEGHATSAAGYYEKAAAVYHDLKQLDKASGAWLEAGKIHARFDETESVRKAAEDFTRAISSSVSQKKIATTHAEIGEAYLKLVDKDVDSEEEEDEVPSPPEDSGPTNDPTARDRVRSTGARYFRDAAKAYVNDGDMEAAGKMRRKAGKILGGSKFQRDLADAAEEFKVAAMIYGGLHDVGKQKDVFLEAGGILLDSENAIGRRLADQFFQSAVNLYASSNEEKVGVLNQIAESYVSSSEVTHKYKAADYYQQASAIYREMNRKSHEVEALVSAGDALSDLNDDVSVAKTSELYEKAIAVYQDNPTEQASTLSKIADSYSGSDEPAKRELAVPFYRREANLAHQTGNKVQEAKALLDAGNVLIGIDRPGAKEEATRVFQEAVEVYRNDVPFQTSLISKIGAIYAGEDPPQKERALQEYQRAIVFAREHNDKAAEVSAILAKARGVDRLGGPDARSQVNGLYDQAIAVFNYDPAKNVNTIIRVGKVAIGNGRDATRVEKAEEYFTMAMNLAEKQQDKKIAGSAHLNIGAAFQLIPAQRPKALRHYESAFAIFEAEGDQFGQAMSLFRLIAVKRSQAKDLATRSLALFSTALPRVESSGTKEELADAYYAIASMHRQKKDYKTAIDNYNKAIAIFKTLPDQASRVTAANVQIRTVQKLIDNPPN